MTSFFRTATNSGSEHARVYLHGLMQARSRTKNMERMEEAVAGADYEGLQHFIANSPWLAATSLGAGYGKDSPFLRALEAEGEVFVVDVASGLISLGQRHAYREPRVAAPAANCMPWARLSA